MAEWWNLEVTITVPFDTRAEADAASELVFDDPNIDRLLDLFHEWFGGCREVTGARIERVTDTEY
jgi:hypothetical protein